MPKGPESYKEHERVVANLGAEPQQEQPDSGSKPLSRAEISKLAKEDKDLGGVIRGAQRERRLLEEKDKFPDAKELGDTFVGSKRNERISIVNEGIKKAFKDTGIESLNDAIKIEDERNSMNGRLNILSIEPGEKGVPQIFYKQITKEKGGLFQKKQQVFTGEVLVIVRLNNSDGPGKGTVLDAIVKCDENGKPIFNEKWGVFGLQSEIDFDRNVSTEKVEGKLLRGEITAEKYMSEFSIQHKERPDEYWRKWDKDIDEMGSPINWKVGKVQENWDKEMVRKVEVANKNREELLVRLQGKYGELLQDLEQSVSSAVEATIEKRRKEKERVDTIKGNSFFEILKRCRSELPKNLAYDGLAKLGYTKEEVDKLL